MISIPVREKKTKRKSYLPSLQLSSTEHYAIVAEKQIV